MLGSGSALTASYRLASAFRQLRRRFLLSAALEALLAALACSISVFLLSVALHAFAGLSFEVRSAFLAASVTSAVAVFAALFYYRGLRRANSRNLAAQAEASSDYGGALVASAEILASSSPRDAVASALLDDAQRLVASRPPCIEYRPLPILIRAAVVIFLLGPLGPLAAGPSRFALAFIDCLFPLRENLLTEVARFEGVEPSGTVPAEVPVDIKVSYYGWPPLEARLLVTDARGARSVPLLKTYPGLFTARASFSKGEVRLTPVAQIPIVNGSRTVAGAETVLVAVPVARIVGVSHEVLPPFPGSEPVAVAGGDIVAPVGSSVSVSVAADVPLRALSLSGITASALSVDGSAARFTFTVAGTPAEGRGGSPPGGSSYTIRPIPQEGFPGEPRSFRIMAAPDGPPSVAAAIVDGVLKVIADDDWALSSVSLLVEPPQGGPRSVPLFSGSGRTVRRTLSLAEVVSGGPEGAEPPRPGKYLVRVVARDAALPEPHVAQSALIAFDFTPPEQADPLLASLPRRAQRYLRSEQQSPSPAAPATPSGAEAASPQEGRPSRQGAEPSRPAKAGDTRLEALPSSSRPQPQGAASSQQGSEPSHPQPAPPRYAGMQSAPGEEHSESGQTPPVPRAGRSSTPEGGLAGTGEKGSGGTAGRPEGSGPGGAGTGAGRPAEGSGGTPVDGGMPTGNETGPTQPFPETVDEERVQSLDVSPDEARAAALKIPPGLRPEPAAAEEAQRSIAVQLAPDARTPLNLDPVPEVYRSVVRLYYQKLSSSSSP